MAEKDPDDTETLKKHLEIARKELDKFERMKPLASAAAAVVHDVRNCLGVISTTAQFVLSNLNPPDKEKQSWELVERNVENIKKILKGYLGLARQTESSKEPFSLNEIVNRVTRFIDVQTKKQNIKILSELEKKIPEINLDVAAVESAVLNIALNAVDAMGKNGILKFRTAVSDNSSYLKSPTGKKMAVVLLEIEDDGSGIPEDALEKIFTPFYTTKDSGTGMGLYSAKAAVEHNQGKIFCQSKAGTGTKMILAFPAQPVSHEKSS